MRYLITVLATCLLLPLWAADDALVVDENGNIGIGTAAATPESKLHVDGSILAKGGVVGVNIHRTDGSGPGDALSIGQYSNRTFIQYPVENVNGVPAGSGGLTILKRGPTAGSFQPGHVS